MRPQGGRLFGEVRDGTVRPSETAQTSVVYCTDEGRVSHTAVRVLIIDDDAIHF